MNREPMKPGPGDEDSWESLAENLFGIDFGRHEDADELISPEELLPEEPAEAAAPYGLAGDESTSEGRAGELAEEADAPEPSQPPRRDDEQEYWDILREWASDVAQPAGEERHWSPVKGKRKKRERRPSAEASPRREEPAATAGGGRDEEEYVEDTGFGAGLVEHESRSRRSRPEPVRTADVEEKEELAEAREKRSGEPSEEERRSRGRRRGRRSRREGPETPAPAREVSADDDFAPPDEGRAPDREGESDHPPRPRRRRRREFDREETAAERSTEKAPDEEEVLVDWSAEPILDSASSAEAEDEDEEDEEREAVATYRNIPTWEEAIACLLNPGATSSRSEEPRERASGRDSGRRRRRRR